MSLATRIASFVRSTIRAHQQNNDPLTAALTATQAICRVFHPVQLTSGDIQKLLYLCEMRELAATNGASTLIGSLQFHATDMGPQCKALQRHIAARNRHAVTYLGEFENYPFPEPTAFRLRKRPCRLEAGILAKLKNEPRTPVIGRAICMRPWGRLVLCPQEDRSTDTLSAPSRKAENPCCA
ncbi:hypothetical protein GCM10019059_39250 [Camelimonas fluminis]|uniref:Uncharacterized protein n=1 Tax=Camelimonas fluminis TaxID=1576911 RepID=A0ABV7UI03_9HYPH|nr:hypothetical protein [Camelimonas fluminis]GHE76041.1 hypothetical protein GCM10019059_39250 [Camelimonas fluminis]